MISLDIQKHTFCFSRGHGMCLMITSFVRECFGKWNVLLKIYPDFPPSLVGLIILSWTTGNCWYLVIFDLQKQQFHMVQLKKTFCLLSDTLERLVAMVTVQGYVQWLYSKGFLRQRASIFRSELCILFYLIVLQFSSVDALCISTAFRSFYTWN